MTYRVQRSCVRGAMVVGLLVAAVAGDARAAQQPSVLLTENGMPRATIVLPAGASEVVSFAAEELQKYLKKISGATLPIQAGKAESAGPVVVLGQARLSEPRRGLQRDSFVVKCDLNRLCLTGNTDRAVLYAVYAFLESLGAAWLEPGEEGEILPQTPTVVARGIDLATEPGFDLRGMCIYDGGVGRQTLDWMGKMRMNFALYPPKGFEKHGILRMAGTYHNFTTRMGLPKDWYKDPANLNYSALLRGQRAAPHPPPFALDDLAIEPCLSNPEAVGRLLATSLKYIEDQRNVYLFDMRASDRTNVWCECPECRKLSPTDIYVKYVNQLAGKVHERWPDKKVSLIAYFNTVFPPREIAPDLSRNNMILWFCPIQRPYRQPINSEEGPVKTKMEFPRNQAAWPYTDGGWNPLLLAWRRLFDGPILILDYYHWQEQGSQTPGFFLGRPAVIAADLKYYHQLGLSGSIGVEPCPSHLPDGLNQYVKARLLWDPSLDVVPLQREYLERLYGQCAPAAQRCREALFHAADSSQSAQTVERVKQVVARFVGEVADCRKTPVVEKRLDRLKLWADYMVLRVEYFARLREKNQEARDQAAMALADFVERNHDQLGRCYNGVNYLVPHAVQQLKKRKSQPEAGR